MVTRLDFDATLAQLGTWIGEPVHVAVADAGGEPPLFAEIVGTLARGSELTDDVGGDEVFWFTFEDCAGGFFLHREWWAMWELWEGTLRMVVGPFAVAVERIEAAMSDDAEAMGS